MQRSIIRTVTVALVATLAILAVAAAPAAAQLRGQDADSSRIAGILAALDSAWQSGAADRWVAHYAQDANFINISGTRMTDRATLEARLKQIFGGIFRGSRHVGTLRQLRFLGADAAVADEDIEITGFSGLPAGISPTAAGVLRTRMRHVFERRGDRWLIVASQNTAVAP